MSNAPILSSTPFDRPEAGYLIIDNDQKKLCELEARLECPSYVENEGEIHLVISHYTALPTSP